MAPETNLVQTLKPEDHSDSVTLFRNHFGISHRKPDLAHLCTILHHFSEIPYENISKIIQLNQFWQQDAQKLRLPYEVITGYVEHRLGGTCFSLTFLLQTILRISGFSCYPVMADMRAGKNIHCCLIVTLNKAKYLVDPGYLLNQPMEINPAKERLYKTDFAGVELRFNNDTQRYDLSTFNRSENKWRYRFTDISVSAPDFLQHWLASFNWNSMHALCLTKVRDNGILYIRKDFMRETNFDGKRNYNIKNKIHAAIHQNFGIRPEMVEQALAALQLNLDRKKASGLWVPRK